jgi:hypothetical protein
MVTVKMPRADNDTSAFLAQIDRQSSRTKYSNSKKESLAKIFLTYKTGLLILHHTKRKFLSEKKLHGLPDW